MISIHSSLLHNTNSGVQSPGRVSDFCQLLYSRLAKFVANCLPEMNVIHRGFEN